MAQFCVVLYNECFLLSVTVCTKLLPTSIVKLDVPQLRQGDVPEVRTFNNFQNSQELIAQSVEGLGYGLDTRSHSSIPGRCKRSCSSPKRPDRLWCSTTPLFNGYRGVFPGGSGRGLKLTTCLHLVPRLRMNGAVPSLPHVSWHAQGQLYSRHTESHGSATTLYH
jgi:hypothetical protein